MNDTPFIPVLCHNICFLVLSFKMEKQLLIWKLFNLNFSFLPFMRSFYRHTNVMTCLTPQVSKVFSFLLNSSPYQTLPLKLKQKEYLFYQALGTQLYDVLSGCTSGQIFLISKINTVYGYSTIQHDRWTLPSLLCRNMFGDV